jgi:microcystin-dependent protein
MAQHDYVIANQSGAAFRADLNNALAAVVSQNSGAAEPSVTYAYMPWADTTNGLFKIRNAANSGWITLYQLDGEWSTIALEDGTAAAPSLYFKDSGTDTGAYSPGADQFAIATGGVQRVNFNGSTEVVFNDGGADVDFRIEGDTDANLFKVDAGLDQVIISSIAYPKTDGSAGQVLATDGLGGLSFATISTVPAGAVFYFAASTAPTGYLKANGAAISRTTYADLFAAVGTTYGSGDGSTTFNLPDLRGEFLRGWDDSRGVDSGRVFATSQTDEFKSHNHTIRTEYGTNQNINITAPNGVYNQVSSNTIYPNSSSILANGGTETRPRNIALLACIKF